MRLAAHEIKPLRAALDDALTSSDVEIVAAMLGTSLDDIAPNAPRPVAIVRLINWAQTRGVVGQLIVEARDINPTNAALRMLAEGADVAVAVPAALQRTIGLDGSAALLSWEEGLGAIEGQVCCIEGVPQGGGTGFLVGPDRVISNHHVVRSLIEGWASPADAKLRFDYKKDREGSVVRPGTVVGLDPNEWLLDNRPPSPLDTQQGAVGLPDPEHLDFALLKLKRALGDERIGGGDAGPPRGWVPFPDVRPPLTPDSTVVILQHPQGNPITIAFGGVIGVDDAQARTRVRYRADTDNGSSGSPVFDSQWRLVALHHSGDPDFRRAAEYNEGVPIDTIVAALGRSG